jgi:PAS domain S-box-containing protein
VLSKKVQTAINRDGMKSLSSEKDCIKEISSQLKILQKVTKEVYSSFNLEKIFAHIAEEAVQTMGYTTAIILTYNEKKDFLETKTLATQKKLLPRLDKIVGFPLKDLSVPIKPDLNETVKRVYDGQIVVAKTLSEVAHPMVSKSICSALQNLVKTKSYIIVPLDIEGELAGAIFISSAKESISENEMEMLKSFRHIVSHALSNASLLKKTESMKESLEKEKAYLDQLLESSQEAVVTTDNYGNVLRVNSEFTKMFGYTREEAVGRSIDDLLAPKSLYQEAASITKMTGEGEKYALETRRRCKNGKVIDVSLLAHPIKVGGRLVGSYAIYRDISARKKAEQRIKDSLREKEVLLKEIHHRVKNNMQIISSLINLQSSRIDDKKTAKVLQSSQNRIKSMAIIHEKLYQSKDFTNVDLSQYVQSLTDHLLNTYGVNKEKIRFHTDIKDIYLDINRAIPCGLIINELLTNSIKHAFPDGDGGQIKIAIRNQKNQQKELVVSDNGKGMPEDLDIRSTQSLGLTLVKILAEEQLQGSLRLEKSKGTRFKIVF